MPKTIVIHSFRHGVGRSTIAANISYLLAAAGQRVAILDTDTVTPSLHFLFGLNEQQLDCSFNHYLAGECDLTQAVHSLTARWPNLPGQLFFIPGNTGSHFHPHPLTGAPYFERVSAGCRQLMAHLNLDVLIIDTQPGLDDQTLALLTLPDILAIVLRHDWRDYQGTGVTVDVVRRLNVPHISLVINESPASFDVVKMTAELEAVFGCPVSAVLPHVDEVVTLANRNLFVTCYPHHPFTLALQNIAMEMTRQSP
jgi:MinD-like ATPase involved in chromosome partitioning or flagellar assembly